ncbi:MAG: hypothetical protein AABZ60_08270 [Planctomycetota bacterium]|mgnify:CR=1 FL=1
MPLLKEILVQNIVEHFDLWLEDQRIRRFHHDGLIPKKIYRMQKELGAPLPKDYQEILGVLGNFLAYSQVELYREHKLVQTNFKTQRRRPKRTIAFACHANGGIFCFENIDSQTPSVIYFSENYEILWKPKCSFKKWYQLLQVYSFVEAKNYFHQDESEFWSESAIEEWKTVYQYLGISLFNPQKELILF